MFHGCRGRDELEQQEYGWGLAPMQTLVQTSSRGMEGTTCKVSTAPNEDLTTALHSTLGFGLDCSRSKRDPPWPSER